MKATDLEHFSFASFSGVQAEKVRVAAFCLLFLAMIFLPVSAGFGLLAGIGFSVLLGNPFPEASHLWAQRFLRWSVVGLGAGIQLSVLWKLGIQGSALTVISVGFTLALGLWLGHRSSLSHELSLLLAAGTAICGGSAIAALGSVMNPRRENLSAALATVFLLNAIALFAFPPLGRFLQFDQQQFGLWSALAIHDTSSVVGAGLQYGKEALEVATTVKLTRALWILPLAVGVSLMRPKGDGQSGGRQVPVPFFILGFLGIAAFFSFFPGLTALSHGINVGAHHLLTGAIFLIGACLSRKALRETGPRPLMVGLGLWLVVAVVSAVAINLGWIGLH